MNYLTLDHISRSYGDKLLFQDISLSINKGEKVALIARNGSGKTSLLRILVGEEEPEGEHRRVLFHPDVRIGYLEQVPHLEENLSVLDSAFNTDNPQIQAIKAYESALYREDNKAVQKAIERIEELKAWDIEAKVKEILEKLSVGNFDQPVASLSGGQKKRLSLAKLLIDEPDFLVLDEPTNHLDLSMIEWLESFLQQPNLTLLLITHDRYFLERVCGTIYELDNLSLYKYSGNYADYLEKKTARKINEAVRFDKNRKLLRSELEWVRRMPKARGTKAKSRIQKFEELREELRGRQKQEEVSILVKPERLGSKILEFQYVGKAFDDLVIMDDFHYKFRRRDRVGVVGPNGSGKTTFLNLMTGDMEPDNGKVIRGETVRFGHYTQEGMTLKEDKRVIEVVRDIAEYIPLEGGNKLTAPALLQQFQFPRSQQQVYVSQLSGGERRRLHLLTVLMTNPNFLILDEPTNDLDIFTLNVLEDYLLDYPGCLVVVSHDRFFMDKLVDHLFVFEGDGRVRDYPGNYSDYRTFRQSQIERERMEKASRPDPSADPVAPPRTAVVEERKLRKALKKIEREVEILETRKREIEGIFLDGSPEQEEVIRLGQELKQIGERLEKLEEEWMEHAEQL